MDLLSWNCPFERAKSLYLAPTGLEIISTSFTTWTSWEPARSQDTLADWLEIIFTSTSSSGLDLDVFVLKHSKNYQNS